MSRQNQPEGITVVIPVRNEEANLPRCISAIRDAQERISLPIEIVVVLNRCTDRSEEIARQLGAVIAREDAKNLSAIRNAGAKIAKFSYLVTIDADSTMSANMLGRITEELSRKDSIGGGVTILPERWSAGIILSGLLLLPLIFIEGLAGGVFFCRKRDFDAIGGFNEEFVSVEDVDFARRLKAYGRSRNMKFRMLWSSYVVTSCRKFDKLGDWFFLRHPVLFYRVFKGKDRKLADQLWYDFER